MYLLLAFSLAFVLYYAYLLFVLYRLNQKLVPVQKIRNFQKSWNFRVLFYIWTIIFNNEFMDVN